MIIKERTVAKMMVAAGLYHMGELSIETAEDMVAHFYQAFKATGAIPTKTRMFYTAFHLTRESYGHYGLEFWERVGGASQDSDDIIFKEVLRCRIAYTWVGDRPYAAPEHYRLMFEYLKERRCRLNGWPRETYLINPGSSTGYITEIQMPFMPL